MGFNIHSNILKTIRFNIKKQDATKISSQGRQEVWKGTKSDIKRRKEGPQGGTKGKQAPQGIVRNLHLQGFEASSSRHRCFIQGNEYHEFLRKRHLRTNCWRSFPLGSLQQTIHHYLP